MNTVNMFSRSVLQNQVSELEYVLPPVEPPILPICQKSSGFILTEGDSAKQEIGAFPLKGKSINSHKCTICETHTCSGHFNYFPWQTPLIDYYSNSNFSFNYNIWHHHPTGLGKTQSVLELLSKYKSKIVLLKSTTHQIESQNDQISYVKDNLFSLKIGTPVQELDCPKYQKRQYKKKDKIRPETRHYSKLDRRIELKSVRSFQRQGRNKMRFSTYH